MIMILVLAVPQGKIMMGITNQILIGHCLPLIDHQVDLKLIRGQCTVPVIEMDLQEGGHCTPLTGTLLHIGVQGHVVQADILHMAVEIALKEMAIESQEDTVLHITVTGE